MEWLQSLLDSSTTPALTAFLLGLLTAISPCPLATNIAAIGFIGKDIENRHRIFRNGLLYTLGRIMAYTLLGIILISILEKGSSLLFMLFGHKFNLPSFGFKGNGEGLARRGGWGALLLGILFAMAFCPTSGIFYFGMLIPMSATSVGGYLLPVLFAIATALPVLATAWILAFSVQHIGNFYGKIKNIQKWLNWIVGGLFTAIGLYYCLVINL